MEERLMSKFSLNELAQSLSGKTGLSQQAAEQFIQKMFEVVNEGLQTDKQVKMKWLGTFKVTPVKDRESVNVNTGERIVIEGRDKISFVPDSILKEIVNKPFAQFETVIVNDGVDFEQIDKKFEEEVHSTLDTEPAAPVELPSNTEETNPKELPSSTEKTAPDELPSNTEDTAPIDYVHNTESAVELGPQNTEPSEVANFLEEDVKTSDTPISDEVIVIGESCHETMGEEVSSEPLEKTRSEELQEEQPSEELQEEQPSEEPQDESSTYTRSTIRRRLFWGAACVAALGLVAGIGWFAFHDGKSIALQDYFGQQLDVHQSAVKHPAPVPTGRRVASSQEEVLRKKAIEDSIRMVQVSEVVNSASKTTELKEEKQNAQEEPKLQNDKRKKKQLTASDDLTAKKTDEPEKQKLGTDAPSKSVAGKYDGDVRVRTGAYRIVGVAEVVVAKEGQSLQSLSKKYFGPGMECYVEALNGTSELKAGQKVKIPKLELKKKSNAR